MRAHTALAHTHIPLKKIQVVHFSRGIEMDISELIQAFIDKHLEFRVGPFKSAASPHLVSKICFEWEHQSRSRLGPQYHLSDDQPG